MRRVRLICEGGDLLVLQVVEVKEGEESNADYLLPFDEFLQTAVDAAVGQAVQERVRVLLEEGTAVSVLPAEGVKG